MISHVKIVILTHIVEIKRLKVKYIVNLWIKHLYLKDKVPCPAVSFKKRFYCIHIAKEIIAFACDLKLFMEILIFMFD